MSTIQQSNQKKDTQSDSKDMEGNAVPMVVVDLGKVSAKRIKKLKKGNGKLMDEVSIAVKLAGENIKSDKELIPIIFVYQKKQNRRGLF